VSNAELFRKMPRPARRRKRSRLRVDAGMDEISAGWTALQVQEQHARQALNIANDEQKSTDWVSATTQGPRSRGGRDT